MEVKKIMMLVAAAGLFSGPAMADDDVAEAQRLLGAAKISLAQATEIAEKHLSGRATDADLDDNGQSVAFEIELLANGRLYDVHVDAVNGTVLRVNEDSN